MGPPPPEAVQSWRPMSQAISSAVANELAFRGIHLQRSLALISGDLSTMDSVRIDVQYLGNRLARSHPNTLHFEQFAEEGEEEEAVADEATVEAEAATGASADPNQSEAAITRTIVAAMERDGREAMTAEEEASLMHDPALRDVINSLDTEERAAVTWGPGATPTTTIAVSGSSGSGSARASAVAPHTPPNFTDRAHGGATAKPKVRRKWEPHLMAIVTLCLGWLINPGNPCSLAQLLPPRSGDSTVKARCSSVLRAGPSRNTPAKRAFNVALALYTWRPWIKKYADAKSIASEIVIADTTCLTCSRVARYSICASLDTCARTLPGMARVSSVWLTIRNHVLWIHRSLSEFLKLILGGPAQRLAAGLSLFIAVFANMLLQPRSARGTGLCSFPVPSRNSRTGPNSGGAYGRPIGRVQFGLIMFMNQVVMNRSVSTDVKVGGPSDMPPGASSEAKPSRLREASMPFQTWTPDTSRIQKRSYQRAYARSFRDGGAFYRGSWKTPDWFQRASVRPVYLPQFRTAAPTSGTRSIRMMTWNARGLSSDVYQELLTVVRDQGMDVCLVQETKWAADNCWSSADFHFIHSAGKGKLDKVGGLLTIVSTRLARRDDLQYQGVHPGRLLHVRAQTGKVCGPHVLPVVETHKSDYMDLLHLCEAQSLLVLNSWKALSAEHTLATFTFGKLQSQIDDVMVRHSMATTEARKAGVIRNYPVASWREGANHHAVEATLPLPRPLWLSRPKPPAVHQIDVPQMIADIRATTPTLALSAFRAEVADCVRPDLHMMDSVVLQAALKHYPQKGAAKAATNSTRRTCQQCQTFVGFAPPNEGTEIYGQGHYGGLETLGSVCESSQNLQAACKSTIEGQTG
ncbi:unnamed protein product [Symbiodinium sp. CCMP2592]|nr:unnamed protein product [Symbiodinium sp. CCMP2592]